MVIICKLFNFRTIPIDSRFYVTHHKIKVLDVKWHPGSHSDVHLMVLTSDNNLRYCEAKIILKYVLHKSGNKFPHTSFLL